MIKKLKAKLKSGSWYPFYNFFYEHLKIDTNIILLESRSGKALESNILALLKELQKKPYQSFRIMLSVCKNNEEDIRKKVKTHGVRVDKFLKTGSIEYYYYLSKAGFLVNDTTFPGRFIKKTGQIYLNTWHGTPLKKMGYDNLNERVTMGNVMRNLLCSDYLVFPNTYMEEKMSEAYMLKNLYNGKILREGYPRNDVFYVKNRDALKKKEESGFGGKKLYAYLPTFRGGFNDVQEQCDSEILKSFLKYWDAGLKEDEILLIKLHPFLKKFICTEQYSHIRVFPEEWDTYEGLSLCDGLITDYSSVFYDYANAGKKIILFAYDREAYEQSRGIYEEIRDYPFCYAETMEEVLQFLHGSGGITTDDFMKRYATYEDGHAAEKICKHVFGKEGCCRLGEYHGDGKENILIYGGDFQKNGITTALFNMLQQLDREKYHYYISFRMNSLKNHGDVLRRLPEDVGIYPMASEMNMDLLTMGALALKMQYGCDIAPIRNRIQKAYQREWKKHFGDSVWKSVIHYNGYEVYVTRMLQEAPCKRIIWVHNDMVQEIKVKNNHNYYILKDAYQKYDYVAAVSDDIVESVKEIGGENLQPLVVENHHDYEGVCRRAREEIRFDKDTESNVSVERLKEILMKDGDKFITIGRFSKEKGHKRLIDAFGEYWKEHQNTFLIIIGGTGALYEETLSYAKKQLASEHIVLIKSVTNPMPILKCCDLFILSSFYEGLGLVLLEADSLGIPVIACDVNGPRGFLKKYGGVLLENSTDGLKKGMELYAQKKIHAMNVDYEEYNRNAVGKLNQILDDLV